MSREGKRQRSGTGSNSVSAKISVQLFQSSIHAFFGGVLADAEGACNVLKSLSFEEAEDDGIAFFFAQLPYRVFEQGRNIPPGFGFRIVGQRLHISFLIMVGPPGFPPQESGGGQT